MNLHSDIMVAVHCSTFREYVSKCLPWVPGSPGALTVLNVDQYEFQGMKMHSAPNRMLAT